MPDASNQPFSLGEPKNRIERGLSEHPKLWMRIEQVAGDVLQKLKGVGAGGLTSQEVIAECYPKYPNTPRTANEIDDVDKEIVADALKALEDRSLILFKEKRWHLVK